MSQIFAVWIFNPKLPFSLIDSALFRQFAMSSGSAQEN
jgi:hypothetical protein